MNIKEILNKAKELQEAEQRHINTLEEKFVPFFESVSEICQILWINDLKCFNFINPKAYKVHEIEYEPTTKLFHLEVYEVGNTMHKLMVIDLDKMLDANNNGVRVIQIDKIKPLIESTLRLLKFNLSGYEDYVSNLVDTVDKA